MYNFVLARVVHDRNYPHLAASYASLPTGVLRSALVRFRDFLAGGFIPFAIGLFTADNSALRSGIVGIKVR